MDMSGVLLRPVQVAPGVVIVQPVIRKGLSGTDVARLTQHEENEILRKAEIIRKRRAAEKWALPSALFRQQSQQQCQVINPTP